MTPRAWIAAIAAADRPDDLHRVAHAERRAALALPEVLALEPLHREEQAPVLPGAMPHVLHDVGVPQIREDGDLAGEARALARRGRRAQELDGHDLVRLAVDAAIDVAHPAAANAGFNDEAIRGLELGQHQGGRLRGTCARAPVRRRSRRAGPRDRHGSVNRLTFPGNPENDVDPAMGACEFPIVELACAASHWSPSSSPAQDPALSRLLRGFESRWGRSAQALCCQPDRLAHESLAETKAERRPGAPRGTFHGHGVPSPVPRLQRPGAAAGPYGLDVCQATITYPGPGSVVACPRGIPITWMIFTWSLAFPGP